MNVNMLILFYIIYFNSIVCILERLKNINKLKNEWFGYFEINCIFIDIYFDC